MLQLPDLQICFVSYGRQCFIQQLQNTVSKIQPVVFGPLERNLWTDQVHSRLPQMTGARQALALACLYLTADPI